MPFYQLNIPEVWKTFTFSERFPGHEELRKYVAHVDKTLALSKDTYFNARVNNAQYHKEPNVWLIETEQGHVARCKYLILATGLLHRTHTPDFPGLEKYQGALHHSGAWPEDFSAKGKKIGLIGAGATSVQITQELGKEADELTIFLRRPSYNLPMQQRKLTEIEQSNLKAFYPALFKAGRASYTGFPSAQHAKGTFDVSEAERSAHFDLNWNHGGFNFLTTSFKDLFFTPAANEEQYKYWRKQVCQRLTDPGKQKIMAPEKMPYYFATKRNPLEQDYYEVVNQSNVHLHDLKAVPLKEFSEKGLITTDGTEHEFDAIVLATGFDSYTGGLTRLGLKNKHGVDLKDLWKDGISSYLGLAISGFPNAFMVYSPQSPVTLSNGPTIIECQVEMIADTIKRLEAAGARSIEPRPSAEKIWKTAIDDMHKGTLFPFTDSWWNGGNIPGKKKENINFIAGIEIYEKVCRDILAEWKGFKVVFEDPKQKCCRRVTEVKHVWQHLTASKDPEAASQA